jgi:energy-coupling factor transporter ATP-binding protein EcfA2
MGRQVPGGRRREVDLHAAADHLDAVADHLDEFTFALSGADTDRLRRERDRLARMLRGVRRRTAEPRAPLLVAVAGGTGAGKSTTVNTLAGATVTSVSAVRPTTRTPTLVCHPDDRAWFDDDRVLPELTRIGPGAADDRATDRGLRLVTTEHLRPGVALLDTPDVDSVELANHALADEALDGADVWVWLATSRTYADDAGMAYLRRAHARQVLTAVVTTQVRGHEAAEVLPDVDRLLLEHGVTPDVRFEIPHTEVVDDRLPPAAVAPLRTWLDELAPTDRRVAVRQRALAGLREATPGELAPVVQAAQLEQRVAERLHLAIGRPYAALPDDLDSRLDRGLSLRAEVLDRWQRSVGGNETLLRLQSAADQLQQLVRSRLGRAPAAQAQQVKVEAVSEVTRLTTELLDHAYRHGRAALEADPVGRDVLDASPSARRGPTDRDRRARAVVDAWEAEVGRLLEEVGAPRKAQARRRSTAINAVATSAILVLFTVSGGLTGGEVGIAAGASAASQWLLVRMFGEQTLRDLLARIRDDLRTRVQELAGDERALLERAVTDAAPPPAAVDALHAAVEAGS